MFGSGVFNLDLGNNTEFLSLAAELLLEIARDCLAFNLLHSRAEQKCPYCVYHDPDQVLALLRDLPCEAHFIDDYLPNDFTVICKKTSRPT